MVDDWPVHTLCLVPMHTVPVWSMQDSHGAYNLRRGAEDEKKKKAEDE